MHDTCTAVEGWIVFVSGVHDEAQEDNILDKFCEYGKLGCHGLGICVVVCDLSYLMLQIIRCCDVLSVTCIVHLYSFS